MKNKRWQLNSYNIHYLMHYAVRSGGTAFSTGVSCPSYTPPAGNNLQHDFTTSYVPPIGNNISVDFCTQQ